MELAFTINKGMRFYTHANGVSIREQDMGGEQNGEHIAEFGYLRSDGQVGDGQVFARPLFAPNVDVRREKRRGEWFVGANCSSFRLEGPDQTELKAVMGAVLDVMAIYREHTSIAEACPDAHELEAVMEDILDAMEREHTSIAEVVQPSGAV